jgi:hypothetical protein
MTSERDIERLLDRWFTERPTQVPDRTLEGVADRIARQPQHPAWRVLGKDSPVTTYFKPLLAVAAVVAIAVAGVALLRGPAGPGTNAPTIAPTPTVQPTPVTSDAPEPSATFAYPSAGILPAGTHTSKSFTPGLTFTVPEGWINDADTAGSPGYGFYSLFPDTPANRTEYARTGSADKGMSIVSNLLRPYFMCEAWEDNRGATAAEMAAAVAGNEAFATTGPIDVTIGGLTGKQVNLSLNPDWTETCPDGVPTSVLADQRTRAIFLDHPGGPPLVMFVGSVHAADHEAFMAEAMPVIESFQFDLGAEASPS